MLNDEKHPIAMQADAEKRKTIASDKPVMLKGNKP